MSEGHSVVLDEPKTYLFRGPIWPSFFQSDFRFINYKYNKKRAMILSF